MSKLRTAVRALIEIVRPDNRHGSKYVGEWKDDKRHGQGTKTYPDGGKYIGEWKDDERWKGALHDREGDVLETYSEGKPR